MSGLNERVAWITAAMRGRGLEGVSLLGRMRLRCRAAALLVRRRVCVRGLNALRDAVGRLSRDEQAFTAGLPGAARNVPRRRIPPSFVSATPRGVLPVDRVYKEMGLSFDLEDGSVVRLRISVDRVQWLITGAERYIAAAASQSSSESGRSSSLESSSSGRENV